MVPSLVLTRGGRQTADLPPLETGDCLDQPTFHARYEAMPEDIRAELIEGIVYMASPLRTPHGHATGRIIQWLFAFADATPGTIGYDGPTAILGPENEPQPDACLLILPSHGGATREQDGYIVGPPELIVEVASSSESIDLHPKRRAYERSGVKEYMVVALRQEKVFWFVLRQDRYEEIAPGDDGIFRSAVFPGLWLDVRALWQDDGKQLLESLGRGLATTEHAVFAAHLAAARDAGKSV